MLDNALFPSSLIDQSVKDSLPKSYVIRPLSRDDYSKGFFQNLQSLTHTGDVSEERFLERFDWLKTKGEGWFYNVVIEHEGIIIGNGVLITERKFIWDLSMVGHLEEISISESHQGKGLGKCVIHALDSIARNVGCGKVILNCSEDNEGFYEKCGYERGSIEMKHEFPEFKGE